MVLVPTPHGQASGRVVTSVPCLGHWHDSAGSWTAGTPGRRFVHWNMGTSEDEEMGKTSDDEEMGKTSYDEEMEKT